MRGSVAEDANVPLYFLTDNYNYGHGMAVIDDRTSYGKPMLYLKRHAAGQAQLIVI